MSVVKAFNDHFAEFVADIMRVFPEDADIATSNTAFLALRRSNPKLVLIAFRDWVARPYASEIENGDIRFFIDKDYNADVRKHGGGGSDDWVLAKIDALRDPVGRMCPDDQNKVMKYLQNLSKLCDLYVSA